MSSQEPSREKLQTDWKRMFQQTLPQAAKSKSSSQPIWPVQLDHCFARIILDKIIGIDTPWTAKIKSPAYKNMSREQLSQSVELGEKILKGSVDLVELDERSLEVRGKSSKRGSGGKKRKSENAKEDEESLEPVMKRRKATSPVAQDQDHEAKEKFSDANSTDSDSRVTTTSPAKSTPKPPNQTPPTTPKEDQTPYISKIALSSKTTFQKKVLTTLCHIPRGRYTTYGIIAKHLSSSARAVGNSIRNNPFAPHVPCHRVLATGGGLGGFHGSWGRKGEEGLHDEKKRKLLRDEGVRFDGMGKVVGGPWQGCF